MLGTPFAGHVGPPRAEERRWLFELHPTGPDRFRADPLPSALLRLYGGQVLAQSLRAAQKTVAEDRGPANFHACFLAPGIIDVPVEFNVTRDADGRSFSMRRVTARQQGRLILTMTATFHVAESGPRAQQEMPDVPPPEELCDMETLLRANLPELPGRHKPFWLRDHMFEWRPVEAFRIHERPTEPGHQHFWVKLKEPWEGPEDDHPCLLTYMSDLHLLHAGLAPLGLTFSDDRLQTASLDHAIWFHDVGTIDDWMLYRVQSPASGRAVALGTGDIFTRSGKIVASTAQQGLIRILPEPRGNVL